ncbi:CAP domain-containing protein [Streptomyces microflavus]|uniref:CAP domain-containing protein n=1 Tax=Streptomyces microflavus TaxID=1919 RepID=UPI003653AEF6
MGRHRRSAAGPAAEEPAAGVSSQHRGTRRKKKSAVPVRTGLLGASAAMAVGAVAVASGLLPGGDTYTSGGSSAADQVRTGGVPDLLTQQGGSSAPADRSSSPASRGSERPGAPAQTPSKSPSTTPSKSPSDSASKTPSKSAAPSATPSKKPAATPSKESKAPTTAPKKSTAPAPPKKTVAPPPTKKPAPSPSDTSARAEVLALVNQERSKVGCSPLTTSAPLTSLAQNFSEDMAARGFFDHTDPDGDTPWDRAAQAGVQGLAAENIARGQADAQAVMDGWMNSEGHRANILNCDYKTIGIGVHEGSGGPWWTQNFGF